MWFVASVKFLVPFSLLVAIGNAIEWPAVRPTFEPGPNVVVFARLVPLPPVESAPADFSAVLTWMAAFVWLTGLAIVLLAWLRAWRRAERAVKSARPASGTMPESLKAAARFIDIRFSTGVKAPGVFGLFRPIRMGLRSEFAPIVYVPYRQNLSYYQSFADFWIHARQDFAVRTAGNPSDLTRAVRQVFVDADPTVAVESIMPMSERVSSQAGAQQFWMRLLGIFSGLGVFLAAIGVYGILSYTVEQRTHEFGIRSTFGARPPDILRLVLREGVLVTVIGLVLGIGGAFAATRLIANQLFGVTPMDPLTIVAVAVVLLAVSLIVCYVPGRRATRLDPLAALRVE
jgi:hypothetical protein